MGENVKAGFAGCGLFPPSKPRMDACIENFKRNGTPAPTRLASWLHIKEVVQKEVLVLPPSKKRTRKTATVAGRLLTKEALDAIAGPTKKPRKTAKSKKVSTTPKSPKAKKPKQVKMLGPVTQQALPAAKPVGILQRGDVVWEAIV
ncbi:hypothetical protein PR001_g20998 [Phytophthora rubi]|uniref:Uncharacterized protein n=1 Tax=Phytophthora rubi TaxID=129364 RepID=A0A6A3JW95_9STRA|nr:hypothetical protein PR001_g20998 [Phytophthora rubi]KAE8996735.1 hypothetical protein PR002_g19233 [Phytophthora rubi]